MINMNELEQMLTELKKNAEQVLSLAASIEEGLKDKTEEPAPETAISLTEVKTLLMEKARSGLNEEVQTLIKSYGVEKLSAVNPSDYADLMKKAEELGNG